MNIDQYVNKRLKNDANKVSEFWAGYEDFKIGVMLRQEREKAGLTQDDVARKIRTTKSVISRIENHADNITISTLERFAKAIGKKIVIGIK
jgi:HTH-type transcriptional regulator / antitoxin HipB